MSEKIPIENEFSEVYKLKNRMQRYQRRLLKEGFKIGKQQNIPLVIKKINDKYDNVAPIIELAKETLPSLYRRYKQIVEDFINKTENLEKKIEN